MWNSSLVMCALMSLPPLTTCCTSWLILPLCPAIRVERISSRVFTLLGLLQLLPAMTNSSLYLPISRQQLSSLFLRFSLSKYFFPNLLVDCEYTAARCLCCIDPLSIRRSGGPSRCSTANHSALTLLIGLYSHCSALSLGGSNLCDQYVHASYYLHVVL